MPKSTYYYEISKVDTVGFRNAELTEEIKKIFWSDKSNNDPRLHNAISRLRRVFENVPSIEIQRYENIGYQLQIRRNK